MAEFKIYVTEDGKVKIYEEIKSIRKRLENCSEKELYELQTRLKIYAELISPQDFDIIAKKDNNIDY